MTEPIGLIKRLRSEAYRIAEYGLQRDHSMAADELERLIAALADFHALSQENKRLKADANVALSEENDALIAVLQAADDLLTRDSPEFENYDPDRPVTDEEWNIVHAKIRDALAGPKPHTN